MDKAKAQWDKASSRGNKGKGKAHRAGSQGNRGQANPASGSGAAFTQLNGDYDLCRYRGKPQPIPFLFDEISQDGGVITISNTDGLKNLRITVNGQRFQVPLGNPSGPAMVDVDVSSALLGSDTIFFTALGKPGTCAMVLPAP